MAVVFNHLCRARDRVDVLDLCACVDRLSILPCPGRLRRRFHNFVLLFDIPLFAYMVGGLAGFGLRIKNTPHAPSFLAKTFVYPTICRNGWAFVWMAAFKSDVCVGPACGLVARRGLIFTPHSFLPGSYSLRVFSSEKIYNFSAAISITIKKPC